MIQTFSADGQERSDRFCLLHLASRAAVMRGPQSSTGRLCGPPVVCDEDIASGRS